MNQHFYIINYIRYIFLIIVLNSFYLSLVNAKPEDTEIWHPIPPIVDVPVIWGPPSDAIILFNGAHMNNWQHKDGSKSKWIKRDGQMIVRPGTGNLYTKQSFSSIQLHMEWKTPVVIDGEGQGRGNSGIFFQNRYELQILDSYKNITYSNGQAASIYKQYIPTVNASKKPGDWQYYDVIFIAPIFDEDKNLTRQARMTIFHNGVLVHNNVILQGTTVYDGQPKYEYHPAEQPLMIQDHNNPISFRNIWIRKLEQ